MPISSSSRRSPSGFKSCDSLSSSSFDHFTLARDMDHSPAQTLKRKSFEVLGISTSQILEDGNSHILTKAEASIMVRSVMDPGPAPAHGDVERQLVYLVAYGRGVIQERC